VKWDGLCSSREGIRHDLRVEILRKWFDIDKTTPKHSTYQRPEADMQPAHDGNIRSQL
jgi:hypothetical protein